MSRPTPRRTQAERRAATKAKLVEAAIGSLTDKGYAATTAQAVSQRSGVSIGGLYRHFPSMLDLVVSAAEEMRRRLFEDFRASLQAFDGSSVESAVTALREACRTPVHGAWYDLLSAARYDPALRERMVVFTEQYHQQAMELARTLPVAGLVPPGHFETAVFTVLHMLDGEAMAAVVHPQPEQEALRVRMVAAMLRGESIYQAPSQAG